MDCSNDLALPTTPSITVALVEDDASCRRATVRLLQAHGFRTVAYPSAEAFLADRLQARPDCLLLDIQLGGMSGLDLQARLVTEGSALPIVFFTALEKSSSPALHHDNTCAGYLSKTEPAEVVLTAIRRAVACSGTAA